MVAAGAAPPPLGQALTAAEAAPAWAVPDVCLHIAGSDLNQRLLVGRRWHRQRQGGECAQESSGKSSALAEEGPSGQSPATIAENLRRHVSM